MGIVARSLWCRSPLLAVLAIALVPSVLGASGPRGSLDGNISISDGSQTPNRIVWVTISGAAYQATTKATSLGVFHFDNVPSGDYVIEVRCPGFDLVRYNLENWSPDRVAPIDIDISANVDSAGSAPSKETISVRRLAVPDKALSEMEKASRESRKGNYDKALKHLLKAVEIYPQASDAWNNIGVIHTRTGRPADALQAFSKAVESDPTSVAALKNLGLAHFMEKDDEGAVRLLSEASRLAPSEADVFTFLGYAYFNLEQYDKAEQALKTAVTLAAQAAPAIYQLAMVYAVTGQDEAAVQNLRRFLELEATGERADAARQYLTRIQGRLR